MTAITLNLNSIIKLTSEQFYQLCEENPDLKLRTQRQRRINCHAANRRRNWENATQNLTTNWTWNEQTELGEVFDSSTGFTLPNKADRSPDASWVEKSRWSALTPEQREKFIPLCPDFVIELVSPSDSLKKTQEKMQEYMENGCRLGWLINRKKREVEIYRPGQDVEVLQSPLTLSGENVLPGFVLNLQKIWN
jgi:Uma2 family endonuclease